MEYEKGVTYSHLTLSGALKASFPFDSISSDRKSRCLYCVKSLVIVVVASACCFTEDFKVFASAGVILVWAERDVKSKNPKKKKIGRKMKMLRFLPSIGKVARKESKELTGVERKVKESEGAEPNPRSQGLVFRKELLVRASFCQQMFLSKRTVVRDDRSNPEVFLPKKPVIRADRSNPEVFM